MPSVAGERGTCVAEVTSARLSSRRVETETLGRMTRNISGQSKSCCRIAVVRNVKLWREQRVTGFCKQWKNGERIWRFAIVGW